MSFNESIDTIVSSVHKLCTHIETITCKIANVNTLIYNNGLIMDLKFYREIYPDLQQFDDCELLEHYIHFGKNERRLSCENLFDFIYPTFHTENYRNRHPDLWEFTDKQLKGHYFQHGRFEGRVCSSPIMEL